MSVPLKVRKSIPRTTFRLTLVTKKVSSKNFTQFALLVIEKTATTIQLVSSVVTSVIYALTFVGLMKSSNS